MVHHTEVVQYSTQKHTNSTVQFTETVVAALYQLHTLYGAQWAVFGVVIKQWGHSSTGL